MFFFFLFITYIKTWTFIACCGKLKEKDHLQLYLQQRIATIAKIRYFFMQIVQANNLTEFKVTDNTFRYYATERKHEPKSWVIETGALLKTAMTENKEWMKIKSNR